MVNSKNNTSVRTLVFFLAIALAIVGLVVSIGRYISYPWEMSITTDNVVAEKFGDNLSVVVDESGNRLIYLDKNNNVADVKSSYTTDNDMYFYSNVEFDDNYVFIKEYCYHKDTHFIKNEKIAKYKHDGTKVADVASFSYDLHDNYANIPRVKSLSMDDNKLYFVYCDTENSNYSIMSVDLKNDELCEEVELKNSFPNLFIIQNLYSAKYNPEEESLRGIDSFGASYKAKQGDILFTKSDENLVDNYNASSNSAASDMAVSAYNGVILSNGSVYSYNILLSARILLFWISIVFLLGVLIVLIVRYFKAYSFDEIINKIKFPVIICIAVAVAGGVLVYVNNNNEETKGQNLDNQITQNVLQQSDALQDDLHGIIYTDTNTDEYKVKYDNLNKQLQYISLLSARGNISVNYSLHKYTDYGWKLIVDSSVPTLTGLSEPWFVSQNTETDEYGVVLDRAKNTSGNYKYASVYIYDKQNKVVGAFVCYKNSDTAASIIHGETIALMLGILSFLIALSFMLLEGVSWIKLFFSGKRKLKTDKKDPREKGLLKEYCLARPLRCLNSATTSADSVIGVIIFQEMLIGTPFEGNMIIIALPMTLTILGRLVGIVAFGNFIKWFGAKMTLLISAFISCISLIACAYFVWMSLIFAVSLALFLKSFFMEFIYLYIQDVPTHITDTDKRKELNNNGSASSICGSAIITIITGYVSVRIGNWCVYLCAAVIVVAIFVLVLVAIPKNAAIDGGQANNGVKKKSRMKDVLRFLFRQDILLMIISAYGICILISGYKSFIFPLFATMNGVSKSDVSNISVFANALAFYITPFFTYVQKRNGSIKIMSISGLMAGVLFIVFIINCSFIWACLVYVLVQLISKFMWPSSSDYWQDVAINSKTESSVALTSTTIASNVLDLSKNGIMGALMGAGTVAACVIIGIYSIVTSLVFRLFARKNSSDKKS